jgi:hypothetical protein
VRRAVPGPGCHSGRVQTLADDEERGDEHHCRIAESGECGIEVQHPVAQSTSDVPTATTATGKRSTTNRTTTAASTTNVMVVWLKAVGRRRSDDLEL